ncbi:PRC-barrel domain-containing protein [Methylobacterium fujisawaense]|uniref:PRC-barrel domain-containing protein n=1 Tax=Methylobacterium fujisawaense TaxID=107400 RepID=UPI00313F25E4
MKRIHVLALAGLVSVAPVAALSQEAGSTMVGVSVAEMRNVIAGWSVKRTILGQAVFNDRNERIGSIDDIIVAPDKTLTYAIVGAGGFLGMDKHDVAVPVAQLKFTDDKVTLPGATKEALKATPTFDYAKR